MAGMDFSQQEIMRLIQLREQEKKSWPEIGRLMQRTEDSCKSKYHRESRKHKSRLHPFAVAPV